MFTDCPSCERLFRIRAAQLKAADGWVKCGYCAETFYALERLHDAPVKKHPPELLPEEAVTEPAAQGLQSRQPDHVPAEQEEAEDKSVIRDLVQPPPEDTGGEQADVSDQQIPAAAETTAVQQGLADDITAEIAENREILDELPPVLASDVDETARSYSRLLWSGLIVILLLIALAQVAWFNRDRLLREYPQLVPWAEKFCERLQCNLIRFRDLSAINLVNRDVRAHPRYRNAVLVSATIVNNAEFVQSFPEIELVIYDTNGRVISHGRFTAAEYLEPGINPAAGMPPGAPLHLLMELAGTVQEAVGFEIRLH